jgi:beta-glucosidase/6-phospho-beta-glucosidase/beta-galactosidase
MVIFFLLLNTICSTWVISAFVCFCAFFFIRFSRKIVQIFTFSDYSYWLCRITFVVAWYLSVISIYQCRNRRGGVMVSMFASSMVDRDNEPRSSQLKSYKIGICCFPTKHTPLRSKSKDCLTQSHENVFEQSNMTTRGQHQWASKKMSSKCNLFSPWYSWNIALFCVK